MKVAKAPAYAQPSESLCHCFTQYCTRGLTADLLMGDRHVTLVVDVEEYGEERAAAAWKLWHKVKMNMALKYNNPVMIAYRSYLLGLSVTFLSHVHTYQTQDKLPAYLPSINPLLDPLDI